METTDNGTDEINGKWNMIYFGIIEDNDDIRTGVTDYLAHQDNFKCVFSENSVEAMLAGLANARTPDVLLLDIGLPGISGLSAIRLLKEKMPQTDIVMFTIHDDPNRIFEALCSGASGYLLKNTPFQEIRDSLEIVHQGGAPMSPQIARKVVQYFNAPVKEKSRSTLSDKEKEVVVGLVDGLSYKMIADRMGITIETVRSHIKKIYTKLHVHSKAEVITMSLKGRI